MNFNYSISPESRYFLIPGWHVEPPRIVAKAMSSRIGFEEFRTILKLLSRNAVHLVAPTFNSNVSIFLIF